MSAMSPFSGAKQTSRDVRPGPRSGSLDLLEAARVEWTGPRGVLGAVGPKRPFEDHQGGRSDVSHDIRAFIGNYRSCNDVGRAAGMGSRVTARSRARHN